MPAYLRSLLAARIIGTHGNPLPFALLCQLPPVFFFRLPKHAPDCVRMLCPASFSPSAQTAACDIVVCLGLQVLAMLCSGEVRLIDLRMMLKTPISSGGSANDWPIVLEASQDALSSLDFSRRLTGGPAALLATVRDGGALLGEFSLGQKFESASRIRTNAHAYAHTHKRTHACTHAHNHATHIGMSYYLHAHRHTVCTRTHRHAATDTISQPHQVCSDRARHSRD
eukprot:COSAG06_NODE_792_length_12273_cov_19.284048_2_plen_226_part_00